ncbi:hypothetical protein N9A04_00205 [Rickettsiales bacterium]|nr:hypothetical protein [Rickettsiales bacterium]
MTAYHKTKTLYDDQTGITYLQFHKGTLPKKVIFAFHGYGSDAYFMENIVRQMDIDAIYVIPNAPQSCNGNKDLNIPADEGSQWFSMTNLDPEDVREGAMKSRIYIENFIRNILDGLGMSKSQTFYMGFSQGAILTNTLGFYETEYVNGIISCSGTLIIPKDAKDPSNNIDFLLTHGAEDHVVPPILAKIALKSMIEHGIHARLEIFEGLDHDIDHRVIDCINQYISSKI